MITSRRQTYVHLMPDDTNEGFGFSPLAYLRRLLKHQPLSSESTQHSPGSVSVSCSWFCFLQY